jgi:hypothetical protein
MLLCVFITKIDETVIMKKTNLQCRRDVGIILPIVEGAERLLRVQDMKPTIMKENASDPLPIVHVRLYG